MNLNIVFDLSFAGFQYGKMEAGIYRVSDELFKRLIKYPNIELSYAVFGYENYPVVNTDIEYYLKGNNYPIIPPVNTRKRRYLPFRKEKLFKFFYKKWNVTDYKNKLSVEKLNETDIYFSIFPPIPKLIKAQKHIKKVILIHDLIPFIFKEVSDVLMREIIDSIDEHTTVICVSEHTKKDLLYYTPSIKEENVYVCPLAASTDIFYPCRDDAKFYQIQKKYNLPKKYFITLSTIEHRKNIDHLIRCFIKMITENKIDDLVLVLVGKKGWLFDKVFEEYENAKELKDRIIFTDFVPNKDLASVFSNAQAFFYMSLYEGFGLPPLEAMQCGLPVVVSNNSSLPEVVGDAGFLIDAKDEKGLCDVMSSLYFDEDLREEYSKKSLKQVQKFSWDKMTEQYIGIFKKIMEK